MSTARCETRIAPFPAFQQSVVGKVSKGLSGATRDTGEAHVLRCGFAVYRISAVLLEDSLSNINGLSHTDAPPDGFRLRVRQPGDQLGFHRFGPQPACDQQAISRRAEVEMLDAAVHRMGTPDEGWKV